MSSFLAKKIKFAQFLCYFIIRHKSKHKQKLNENLCFKAFLHALKSACDKRAEENPERKIPNKVFFPLVGMGRKSSKMCHKHRKLDDASITSIHFYLSPHSLFLSLSLLTSPAKQYITCGWNSENKAEPIKLFPLSLSCVHKPMPFWRKQKESLPAA